MAIVAFGLVLTASDRGLCQSGPQESKRYLGFDRNQYPGESNLRILRKSFTFSGYWLNTPPGAESNSWVGKRDEVLRAGFGFLVVFNGRTYAQIKAAGDAIALGAADGKLAAAAALREGFPLRTIIFLDQEEGGRLLPDQRNYLHAWADAVRATGYGTGVYCSGIPSRESSGVSVMTAENIRQNAGSREFTYWVSNDACPPSPGCAVGKDLPKLQSSGVSFAAVWQYAQSPRQVEYAVHCPANYSRDGNCYAPGAAEKQKLYVDLDVATSPDPSHGRSQNQAGKH